MCRTERELQFIAANDRLYKLLYPENWQQWVCAGVLLAGTVVINIRVGLVAAVALALILRRTQKSRDGLH